MLYSLSSYILYMEDCVHVSILNQQRILHTRDFYTLKPLIQAQQVGQIKSSNIPLDANTIKVLHIFLYFIIKVTQDLSLPGLEHQYHQELNPYYISHGLQINIFQFAFNSSKILTLTIQDCAHVIYYLIYGRLATPSFVSTICKGQGPYQKTDNPFQSASNNKLKKKESKHIKGQKRSFMEDNRLQTLQIELQGILKPRKAEQNLQLPISTPKQRPEPNDSRAFPPNSSIRIFSKFFPKRVLNGQKSAILNTSGQNKSKLLRKKRFDEFDAGKWKNSMNSKDKLCQKGIKEFLSFNLEKQRKKRQQNFNYIIEEVRNSSSYLDRIRNAIEDNRQKIKNKMNDRFINTCLASEEEDQNQRENSLKETEDKENKSESEDEKTQQENPFTNLLRKDMKKRHPKVEDSGSESYWKKKSSIFKFKSEYRTFLRKQHFFRQHD